MSKKPAPARSSINLNEPCSVDAKGRVLLTKELKEAFVGEVKLVQDIQKFIRVYTKEVFEEEELDIKQTFSRGRCRRSIADSVRFPLMEWNREQMRDDRQRRGVFDHVARRL